MGGRFVMKKVSIPENFDLSSVHVEQPVVIEKEQSNKEKLREIIRSLKIDRTKIIAKPEACLSIMQGDKEAIIATLGNFSLIIGKAKSKKTFSLIMFFHAIVANQTTRNNFKGNLPQGKTRAIFFDTEQGEYHVQKFDNRVCTLLGISDPINFESYPLRKFTPEERLSIINQVIEDTPDLGFVAIDGIRDLVNSINNEEEATKIASHLLKWTGERKIHIVTVLHQNKGDNNARGHLGTELVNKAETVLSVTKSTEDKELSIVNAEDCREMDPEPFAFKVNENGLPELVSDWTPSTQKNNSASHPEDMDDIIHEIKLQEIFRSDKQQRGSELLDRIQTVYNFGQSKATKFRTYFKDQGLINWNSESGKINDPKGFWTLAFEDNKEAVPLTDLSLFDNMGV